VDEFFKEMACGDSIFWRFGLPLAIIFPRNFPEKFSNQQYKINPRGTYRGTIMFIRDNYITDACASKFKDMDGKILQMTSNIDNTCDGDLLCNEDKSVMAIFDEEDEESCAIQEGYELINCSTI
jgi:hypothetical protein